MLRNSLSLNCRSAQHVTESTRSSKTGGNLLDHHSKDDISAVGLQRRCDQHAPSVRSCKILSFVICPFVESRQLRSALRIAISNTLITLTLNSVYGCLRYLWTLLISLTRTLNNSNQQWWPFWTKSLWFEEASGRKSARWLDPDAVETETWTSFEETRKRSWSSRLPNCLPTLQWTHQRVQKSLTLSASHRGWQRQPSRMAGSQRPTVHQQTRYRDSVGGRWRLYLFLAGTILH